MKQSKSNILTFNTNVEKPGDKKISYSQFTMWANCPRQWKLTYMDGYRVNEPSIFLIFGTAMHETLQEWLDTIYTKSLKEANEMNLNNLLLSKMKDEFAKAMVGVEGDWVTKNDMIEFYEDGIQILEYLQKHRASYFSTKTMRLVGIELPIYYPLVGINDNIYMKGFIDITWEFVNTGNIEIWDFKTSRQGWNDNQKKDKTKTAQLVLYKKFFSEQYGYPIDKIDVKYFILKRKLWEDAMFAQKRIQEFSPASGKPTINKIVNNLSDFVKQSFNEDGSYNTDGEYPALKGKNNKNCKYCLFRDKYDLCSKSDRS